MTAAQGSPVLPPAGCWRSISRIFSRQQWHFPMAVFSDRVILCPLALAALLVAAFPAVSAQETGEPEKDAVTPSPGTTGKEVPMSFETGRFVVRNPVTGRAHRIVLDLRKSRWDVRVDGNRVPKALRQALRDEFEEDILFSSIEAINNHKLTNIITVRLTYERPILSRAGAGDCGSSASGNQDTDVSGRCYIEISYGLDSHSFLILYRKGGELTLLRCPEFRGCP